MSCAVCCMEIGDRPLDSAAAALSLMIRGRARADGTVPGCYISSSVCISRVYRMYIHYVCLYIYIYINFKCGHGHAQHVSYNTQIIRTMLPHRTDTPCLWTLLVRTMYIMCMYASCLLLLADHFISNTLSQSASKSACWYSLI